MAVDNTFFMRSVQKREDMIVAYCLYTNMPLVVCDPESYNDQVFIFENEDQLKEFAKPYVERKIAIRGMKFPNKAFLRFFTSLFYIGVNELVFITENGRELVELDHFVRRPDFSKLPKEQQPTLNPSLQLTGLYFMQEASRPVPNEEKQEALAELEEELSANLLKGRFVVPVELQEGPESDVDKLRNRKYRLPILKGKNDEILQPVFTDPFELSKFNKDNKFKAIAMPFAALSKLVIKDSKGFLLNPGGFHLLLPVALVKTLQDRFVSEEEANKAEEKNEPEG